MEHQKMTAGELFEALAKLPPDTVIYIADGEAAGPVNIDRFEPYAQDNPRDRDSGKWTLWPGWED